MKSPDHYQADQYQEIRDGVRALCAQYPDEYFRKIDEQRAYPETFVNALTEAGWLAALIPQEYGGSGLGLAEASVIMEEINRCGGNSGACHGQMYNMGTLVRHGSEEQKRKYLPKIASGELRLQSMARDRADDRDRYDQTQDDSGEEGRPLRRQRSEGVDLAPAAFGPDDPARAHDARDAGCAQVRRHVDLRRRSASGDRATACRCGPFANMVNHETNELFFDNLEIPAENLIGEEGKGFKYILDGLNAERTLIAAECIGDGYWFVERASKYANERVVFDRPIGKNQGVQFPIAESYIEIEAANLMRFKACALFDAHKPCGAEANMAKYLAAKASWEAANVCLQTHGGFGFACEYDVERKFRETRLYQVAPISTNLVLSYIAEHVLGLPRSF